MAIYAENNCKDKTETIRSAYNLSIQQKNL